MSADKGVLAILSHLTQRLRSWRDGLQYGDKRDIYKVAGYKRNPSFDNYLSEFERNGLARRIVAMKAETTWREPPEVLEDERPDGTKFTRAFQELVKRLDLWAELLRLDILSGIGRYGVLLIGTRGVDDATGLRLPQQRLSGPKDVLFVESYHEGVAEIELRERNPGDPRYHLPAMYRLRPQSEDGKASVPLRVHWSRTLHVAEGVILDRACGTPRLQPVLNRLDDLEKVLAGTSEGVWQAATPILQAKIDPKAEVSDAQLEDLDEQGAEMVHDLRRWFMGQGVDLSHLLPGVTSPKDAAEVLLSAIAGAVGIPKRMLSGSELGELASSTDQQTYFGGIAERQRQFAEPRILRAFINRMVEFGVLPAPETGEYQVVWPTLFKESEDTIAGANLKRAQTAQALTPVGGDPRELVEVTEDRNVWLLPQTPEEAQALREQNEEPLPPPEPVDEPEGGTV